MISPRHKQNIHLGVLDSRHNCHAGKGILKDPAFFRPVLTGGSRLFLVRGAADGPKVSSSHEQLCLLAVG